MSLDVRWTDEAEFTFDVIVIYIQNDWGEKAADKFRDKTSKVLNSISHHPLLFPEADLKVCEKQSSLNKHLFFTRYLIMWCT